MTLSERKKKELKGKKEKYERNVDWKIITLISEMKNNEEK